MIAKNWLAFARALTDGTPRAASARVPKAIRRVQGENLMLLNTLRVAMTGAFAALFTYLAYGARGPDSPSWQSAWIPMLSHFCVALVVYIIAKQSISFRLRSRFAVPVVDVPFVLWIQWLNLHASEHPRAVAEFSLSLFLFLVILAALSLDLKCLLLTATVATISEILLQAEAGVGLGGRASGLILIAGCVIVCIYAAWKRLEMVTNLTNESLKRERLGRYFSPAITQMLEARPDDAAISAGTSRELTILFSDIRGFTALSESLPAQDVVALLNQYHASMVDKIFEFGGTLDKFMGDGIMAYFNAPLDQDNHAQCGIECALAMQQALDSLNATLRTQGKPPLQMGIGIHTGVAVVGDIGAPSRKEFTAIGDSVNLASRLESLTKNHDADILLSSSTRERAGDGFSYRAIGEATVRGKSRPVRLFAPSIRIQG